MSDLLPDAVPQNPACGTCQAETWSDGDGFTCEDCQLAFDAYTFEASFINPNTPACGAACDNHWHGDHKIRHGLIFDCGVCQLPEGHQSAHWTGCTGKEVTPT